jgi:histidinol-phosphate aminotransferase
MASSSRADGGTHGGKEPDLTRRRFAGSLGAALGGALLLPRPADAKPPAAATPVPAADPKGAAASKPTAPAAAAPETPQEVPHPVAGPVRLDSNENPYGPPRVALDAMERSRARGARYPDSLEDELTAVLAKLHLVEPDQIVLGCGSGEVLKMADEAFLTPAEKVVVAEPTFEAVSAFADVVRAEQHKVPLDRKYQHDLDAMAAACDTRTGVVYLCNPNNPTGTILPAGLVGAFLRQVPKDTVVLVDEAYHHFVEDADYGSADRWLSAYPNLVVVRTFSKIYGLAGMRLGYGIGSKSRIAAMARHKCWSNTNTAVLEAALAVLKEPGLVTEQRRMINDTRRWLCDELAKDGRIYIPSQTNFVMIRVGGDVKPIIAAFRDRDIWTGRRFASMPDWLRITIGTKQETAAFLKALRTIVPTEGTAAA